jgi:hypothetical protein
MDAEIAEWAKLSGSADFEQGASSSGKRSAPDWFPCGIRHMDLRVYTRIAELVLRSLWWVRWSALTADGSGGQGALRYPGAGCPVPGLKAGFKATAVLQESFYPAHECFAYRLRIGQASGAHSAIS